MGSEPAISAHKPQGLPRASKRFGKGRVCAHEGCETLLSVYNRRDKCWAHADFKIPRLRGRDPAPEGA